MQSRRSSSEIRQCFTEALNRYTHDPSTQSTEEQVVDMFGGDYVMNHLENLIDELDGFCDAHDGVVLEVKLGKEDNRHPSKPDLATLNILSVPYLLRTADASNWAVVLYKNAVTLTALHGEDVEAVDFDNAFTITIWAA